MIPSVSLPSNPSIKIALREATVKDCLDFAGVPEGLEEEMTTLFLNTVQEAAAYSDAKTWTADDRRFALFLYWSHTVSEPEQAIPYRCPHCREHHVELFDYRTLIKGYRGIAGKAERPFEFDGYTLIVRPLTGAQMEILERLRLDLADIRASKGEKSGEYGRKMATILLLQKALAVEFPQHATAEAAIAYVESLPEPKFRAFVRGVNSRLAEMTHGLPTVLDKGRMMMLTPPFACENREQVEAEWAAEGLGQGKEATTQLWIPFRGVVYVPRLQQGILEHHHLKPVPLG